MEQFAIKIDRVFYIILVIKYILSMMNLTMSFDAQVKDMIAGMNPFKRLKSKDRKFYDI